MKGIKARLTGYLESLKFPWLLLAILVLLVVNIFIPDALPFIDEILLALVAALLARIKRKPSQEDKPQ